MKYFCSDCKSKINFATNGRKIYVGIPCSKCGRKTLTIAIKK